MKAILKGMGVILLTLALASVLLLKAHAGTSDELLKILSDKLVVYQGVCNFGKDGKLTFKHDEVKKTLPCVVGMEPGVPTKHYILLINQNGEATEVLLFDEEDKSQKSIWRKGSMV